MIQPESIKKAAEIGNQTFINGESQIPAQSKELMQLIADLNLQIGEGLPILEAFIAGWHRACNESFYFDIY